MIGFKAQSKRDLQRVFHNDKEHADKVLVEYGGKQYKIPVIIDSDGARERKKYIKDHADGIFISDMTVYISFYDLKILPRKETKIIIDDTAYMIMRVALDAGSITLDLEVLDE